MFLSYYLFYNKFPLKERVFVTLIIFCGLFRGISKEKSYFQKFGTQDFGKKKW